MTLNTLLGHAWADLDSSNLGAFALTAVWVGLLHLRQMAHQRRHHTAVHQRLDRLDQQANDRSRLMPLLQIVQYQLSAAGDSSLRSAACWWR